MREAPQFHVSPAPTPEEAASIAAALAQLIDEQMAAAAAMAPEPQIGLSRWVAEGRSRGAQRGAHEYRHLLAPGAGWRFSGRARVWGSVTVW